MRPHTQLVSTAARASFLVAASASRTDCESDLARWSRAASSHPWDQYALVLLLPVAYLLSAGRWWAALIPLATAWPLVGITPPIVYPAMFWLTLVATFLVGRAARDPRTSIGERWAV